MDSGFIGILVISAIVGVISGFVSSYVNSDKRSRLNSLLPNLNCGSCGKQNCSEYVAAIINREENLKPCFPIIYREEFKLIEKEFDYKFKIEQPLIAQIMCSASIEECEYMAVPSKFSDCHSAVLNNAQLRKCSNGCLLLGSCEAICPSDAIRIGELKINIDHNLCTGCGLCVDECPVDLIKLIPKDSNYFVACANQDKGTEVHKYCSVGCLGCDVCSKVCPENAIVKFKNLVYINQNKCINCELCAIKCPTNSIITIKKNLKFAIIKEEKCDGCGECVKVCPVNAIKKNGGEKYEVIDETCIGCGLCIRECPRGAIDERITI